MKNKTFLIACGAILCSAVIMIAAVLIVPASQAWTNQTTLSSSLASGSAVTSIQMIANGEAVWSELGTTAVNRNIASDAEREIRYRTTDSYMITSLSVGSENGARIPIDRYVPASDAYSNVGNLNCRLSYTDSECSEVVLYVKGTAASSIYVTVSEYTSNFVSLKNAGGSDIAGVPELAGLAWFDGEGKLIIRDIYNSGNGYNCSLPTAAHMNIWKSTPNNPYNSRVFSHWTVNGTNTAVIPSGTIGEIEVAANWTNM